MAIRILWLTENYPPQRGGMAQSCDRLISGLRENDYEIEIIHFTNQSSRFKRVQQKNGGYTAVSYEDSEPHTLNITWNYIKTLGDFDYLASFGGYLAMIAAPIYKQWMKVKLITFLRGNDFDTAIFTPRKREMLQSALQQSDLIFSVSREKVDKVNHWLPDANIHFVANGIDLTDWTPTASELEYARGWKTEFAPDKICLGLIGQLKPKKGVQFFIEAFTKTSLTDKVHLLLIGDIEEGDQEQLNQKDLSYSLLPFQDRYQLMKYYLCCDGIVIPSFYDGMPNVMLEAGALGIPIIASDVDGMADVISHEEDGLLFRAGDEDECRKILYQFISLEEKRKDLGQALKIKITNQYTQHHEIEAYKKYIV